VAAAPFKFLIMATIDALPRQAQDKRKKSPDSTERRRGASASVSRMLQDTRTTGEKTALFVHFLYKNDHFTKTGSG
jgi:hypothetical protein